MPDEVDQPAQPPVSPHDFVDPPASSDRPETSTKISIADQIRRRNRKRAQQDAAAQSKKQLPADIAQDIEWENTTKLDDLTGFLQFAENADLAAPVSYVNTPLTQGQAEQVDHLLSVETDSLAREVLITLKRDGIPPRSEWNDFMAQYALFSWDAESDAQAWATLATIANSDWDETLALSDWEPVETTAQDLGDDWIEGLVIIHAKTGDTLLDIRGVVTKDGSQYVGLQDTEVEALKGLPLIFVHNHRDTDASNADLISAFNAGAKLLIVITRYGQEYVYIRGRDRMVKVREGQASYEIGPGTLDETLWLQAESQARRYLVDAPEYVFLQEDEESEAPTYIPTIGVKVSGTLRVYTDEAFDPNVDAPVYTFTNDYSSGPLSVIRYSALKPFHVLVEIGDLRYWIDTADEDAEFIFVMLGEYDETSTQPPEGVVATGTPSGYEILPIIPDEKAHGGELNVEISDRPWADKTSSKLGVRTRDYNRSRNIHKSFRLQSPVIGPDVRVEFVVAGHKDLGNYVVVSFAASVYQSNDKIMQQLEWQGLAADRLRTERPHQKRLADSVDHNPDLWQEDGRIFYAFAHLSEVYVNAGEIIDSEGKAIIGMSGNTGREGMVHHLDLAVVYIGSSQSSSGAMEEILNNKRKEFENTGSRSVEYFFDLVQASQLYPHNDVSVLYAENLESARIHPELDEYEIAEFPTNEGDPNASIYFEDE